MNKFADYPSIITFFISLAVCVILFLIFRVVMLWYWKIDQILKNQEQQSTMLTNIYRKQNRNAARACYYTHRALGDNSKAHEYLLQMIFEELTTVHLKADDRKIKYNSLKEQYSPLFIQIGFEFPAYPY